MMHESLLTDMLVDPSSPDYGVVVLLHSYYMPVRRHSGSPNNVIEAFWTDDTSHVVMFHEVVDAWRYIERAKAGTIVEYLPSQAYTLYREFQKAQEHMNAQELAQWLNRAHAFYDGKDREGRKS